MSMSKLKILLTLFVLFFSLNALGNNYPYDGKTALDKRGSKSAGFDHEWLRLCAGKASENARWTEKEVKKLSKPDYKIYSKERTCSW